MAVSESERPRVGGWAFAIFFFGVLGGGIGWLQIHADNPSRADHILKWSLIWTAALMSLVVVWVALQTLGTESGGSVHLHQGTVGTISP